MREIKFRAWDKKQKIMGYNFFICLNEIINFVPTGEKDMVKISRCRKENVVAMQFTGIKDKSGEDIYEGDIVKITHITKKEAKEEGYNYNYYFGLVKFGEYSDEGEGSWGYGFYYEDYYLGSESKWNGKNQTTILTKSKVEIIGNKFENPKLLDVKEIKSEVKE